MLIIVLISGCDKVSDKPNINKMSDPSQLSAYSSIVTECIYNLAKEKIDLIDMSRLEDKETFARGIDGYISTNLKICINNFSPIHEQNTDVSLGDFISKSIISEDLYTSVYVEMPITIKKEGSISKIDKFLSKVEPNALSIISELKTQIEVERVYFDLTKEFHPFTLKIVNQKDTILNDISVRISCTLGDCENAPKIEGLEHIKGDILPSEKVIFPLSINLKDYKDKEKYEYNIEIISAGQRYSSTRVYLSYEN